MNTTPLPKTFPGITDRIPKLTQDLMQYIELRAHEGPYALQVAGCNITVDPFVFPPASEHSISSRGVYQQLGKEFVYGKSVLDLGTGSGILGIVAAKNGARQVDASDFSRDALKCATKNARQNNVNMNFYLSDMFDNIPRANYDLIIANLPILPMLIPDPTFLSLFDPAYSCHKRLFAQSPQYLARNGNILMCTANLIQSGFKNIESIAKENNFRWEIAHSAQELGHEWRTYIFNKK